MRYYATASGPKVRDAMCAGLLGQIVTPAAGNALLPGVDWCADNSVFGGNGGNYPGDDEYLGWLDNRAWAADRCAFAVAPDVVCDAAATLDRAGPMLPRIRSLGLPAAFALQNGAENLTIPWPAFDVAFIGGDTDWKIGPAARALTVEAHNRGKRVHMGRVNSRRRLQIAEQMGCDSVDGTFLAFGPDQNTPKLLGWLRELDRQLPLWSDDAA